ncbi:hypothetical protein BDY17DRAFT_73190 [Neohortaea acidophila]|uniref:Acetyl-CoA synthetase-like protein n=1 Tax=Neohortaea acidophila TaxID=245834 RepID=A0A6A6Q4A7_9PEZI|nr:uncharacterized protein BDY17DRAFT_73190 [Neohortaea acidophila]KAF2486227.1 hypothetical protein BDY17DRAFT_73190 [Neohortaea acidophila]
MARPSEVFSPDEAIIKSTWQMFEDGAQKKLDAPVLTACHQAADHCANLLSTTSLHRPPVDCLQWTFGELRHASLVVAKAMQDAGVQRGMTVAALIPNGIETHIVRVVSFILQLTLVALDRDLVKHGRRDEFIYYIRTTTPDMVLVADSAAAESVDEATGSIGFSLAHRFITEDPRTPGWTSWAKTEQPSAESLEVLAGQEEEELDQGGDRVALVLFTSGTSSGRPKGCPQTVRNITAAAYNQMWIADIGSSYAVQSPSSRAVYNCMGAMAIVYGHHVVLSHSHFTLEALHAAVGAHSVEMLLLVPAQVRLLAAQHHLDFSSLTSVKRVVLGGDIITIDLIEKAEELFPHASVSTVSGMSEGTGFSGMKGEDKNKWKKTIHSIVSVGKVARGARLRICDSDGKVLPRGEEGELLVAGPMMIDRYLNDDLPEQFVRDEWGTWIKTGDTATMDEDDHIFIVSRTKDVVKQSGINISPAVVEATLSRQSDISAAVLGVPDAVKGEVPVAIVTGGQAEDVKEIVQENLGDDYALKAVYDLHDDLGFEELPLSAQGKVQKHLLKEAVLNLERKKLIGAGLFRPWFL